MARIVPLLAGSAAVVAVIAFAALGRPVFVPGGPQSVSSAGVDVTILATGYRTSKVVGSTVVNEAGEAVGTIDDLIVTPGGRGPFAVLSVGGFLGVGTKYVVVPADLLKVRDHEMLFVGASEKSLKNLTAFTYTK